MFLLVNGQHRTGGRGIGDIGSSGGFFNDSLAKVQFAGPTRDRYKHAPGLTSPSGPQGMAK